MRENNQAHTIRHIEKEFRMLMETAEEDRITPSLIPMLNPLNYKRLVEIEKKTGDF